MSLSFLGTLLGQVWAFVKAVLHALDLGLVWFAYPFGVHIRDPRKRYPLLLGVFLAIYVLGCFPLGMLPLIALGLGYVGVLAIGRAWVVNEKQRTAISKKLQ